MNRTSRVHNIRGRVLSNLARLKAGDLSTRARSSESAAHAEIIDIAHWEPVNWDVFNDPSIDGVIYKITEGVSFVDSQAAINTAALVARPQMIRGTYHYWREQFTVEAQMSHWWDTVQKLADQLGQDPKKLSDIYVLDVESKNNPDFKDAWKTGKAKQMANHVIRCLAYMQEKTGQIPWLYSNIDGYQASMASDPRLQDFPYWVAWPVPTASRPRLPKGRTPGTWILWQDSWWERYEGIQGAVDHNRVNGTLQDLKNLVGFDRDMIPPDPPTPPGPPPINIDMLTQAVVDKIEADYLLQITKNNS